MKSYLTITTGNKIPDQYEPGSKVEFNGQTYEIDRISDDRRTMRVFGEATVLGRYEKHDALA
jgi:hypothetical protein